MARKPRLEWEGASYHVMARGNRREKIFATEEDYQLFVRTLGQSVERFGIALHAWVLMPNHFHLAVTTPRANLSRWMAWLQTTFTIRHNRFHRRVGHLFQGRYRAEIVEDDAYATTLVRYIHLNPVRRKKGQEAKFIGGLEELKSYPWSGHLDLAGLRKDALLVLDEGWRHYWAGNSRNCSKAYLRDIRQALGKPPENWEEHVERGLVAANEEFVEKVTQRLVKQNTPDAHKWSEPVQWGKVRRRLEEKLTQEQDPAFVAWVRTRLLGEKGIEVARSLGYKDGSGVSQSTRRLEQKSRSNPDLLQKMEAFRGLSIVKN